VDALIKARLLATEAVLGEGWQHVPSQRRAATKHDPLLFAYLYLPHHLRSEETGDKITLSAVHKAWADHAEEWTGGLGGPQEHRDVFVAPRGMGKSTWHFLLLPMWAAAHGHVKFIAAFADSATQAETHLQTFRHELDSNTTLRKDYPELVRPAVRGRRSTTQGSDAEAMKGTLLADNRGMLMAASGFVFAARGIDSGNLGMKVGNRRPDLLILDDVEPGEDGYSAEQVKKRLGTIRDVIFPLNINARVVIVGTTTMPGSIIHQLVRAVRGGEKEPWIAEENVTVHYHAPFITHDDGRETSVWPGRWSTEFLNSIRHTRTFAKNYANDPRGYDGGWPVPRSGCTASSSSTAGPRKGGRSVCCGWRRTRAATCGRTTCSTTCRSRSSRSRSRPRRRLARPRR
jgi:hypothetical protein